MTVSPAAEEQDALRPELLQELFQQLINSLMKGAAHRPFGNTYVRLFPLHKAIDVLVTEPEDEDIFPQGSLDALVPLAEQIRELQYSPEVGAWSFLTFEIDAEGEIRISVNFDGKPEKLNGEPLALAPVVTDLEKHPRNELVEWLAEAKTAQEATSASE